MKESQLFKELEGLLPISGDSKISLTSLDKTSLIRLTLANLKCREVIQKGLSPVKKEDYSALSGLEMVEAMYAFCLIMSKDMEVLFVTSNVETQIGLNALELTGQSLCDYVHPCDHHQLKKLLSSKTGENQEAYVRVKVTVTERGRMINLRQANYKLLKISGIVRNFDCGISSGINGPVFLGLGQLLSRDTLSLDMAKFQSSGIFQTKHMANMDFVEADQWLTTVGQYPVGYLLGMSFYEFIHVEDSQMVQKAFTRLCDQGECQTEPYRFLVGGGGWVWVQTRANLVIVRKGSSKGNSVCCTHTAISEVMNRGDILGLVQVVTSSNMSRKNHQMDIVNIADVQSKKNIGNIKSQKVDPLVRLDLIPEVKFIDEMYSVFKVLDEGSTIQQPKYEQPNIQLSRYEDNIFPLTNSDDASSTFHYPTPSVIVEPNNATPKASTECILQRTSVIVTSPASSTIVHPDQVSRNLVNPKVVLTSDKPHAVTTVVFDHTEEPYAKRAVCPPLTEPTTVNIFPEKFADVDIDSEDEDALGLLSVPMHPLDLDSNCDLEQLSPSSSDDFVEVNLQEIPLFDITEEPYGKKSKMKENEKKQDNSEEFFKIMSESTSPGENKAVDFCQPNNEESYFVKNNSQVMWGLDEADPQADLEAFLPPIYNQDSSPDIPFQVHPASTHFQYNPSQEKVPNISSIICGKMDKSTHMQKPTIPPKLWSTNASQMENRKRSSTWIATNKVDKPNSTSQFPELQKLLEGQHFMNDATAYCTNNGNSRIMENPKQSRMEYQLNGDAPNFYLPHKK